MQIRHICPGSMEWNDAVSGESKEADRLTPEEMEKLRAAWEMGEAPRPDTKRESLKV